MIKKPEDNIDASHRLSIDNFTIIKKFKVRNIERAWSSLPEGPGRGWNLQQRAQLTTALY